MHPSIHPSTQHIYPFPVFRNAMARHFKLRSGHVVGFVSNSGAYWHGGAHHVLLTSLICAVGVATTTPVRLSPHLLFRPFLLPFLNPCAPL
mmetsp:Transcript_16537/g.45811  ORF Transcript_16537/g.45811 Transcript_16537/m.45811 type:complete len:91 (+) Transcript_16537:1387-1659(+)